MRGRLINPFVADLRQLDTVATAASVDGGSATGGYDEVFRTPVRVPDSSARGSHSHRVEKDALLVPCQVDPGFKYNPRQGLEGLVPQGHVILLFHFRDLERLGLLDAHGASTIRNADRLAAIYSPDGATAIQSFPDPPGQYVINTTPISWGFRGGSRNVLRVEFAERDQALPR